MQTKHDNSLTTSQKKIYDAIVWYLKNLYIAVLGLTSYSSNID